MQQQTQPTPPPPRQQTMVLRECAICQSSIYPAEATHPCPRCGLVFHAECWQENFGCASYGCDQVNALAPKVDIPPPEPLPPPIEAPIEPLPWDFMLLGLSALAMAFSALSYGLPSIVASAAVGHRIWRTKKYRDPILITAALLCVIGVVGGLAVSRFWFAAAGDYTSAG